MFVFQKIFSFIKVNIFNRFHLFCIIFNINRKDYFKYLKSFFNFYFLAYLISKSKLSMKLSQRGMLLLEMILMALFLGGLALSTSYYFTQTQATLSSSSQATSCQNIVKQALEDTVSLGARLYGYKINHKDSNLRYNPLFITKNANAYDVDGNIKDVNDGSELSFPPERYKTLFKNLGITASVQSPKDNTDKFVIGDTYPFDISTSVLLVNSVNALQYLYNSDNGFFTANGGKGKKYTVSAMSSGSMSSVLEKYANRFDLEDVNFYIKIAPIDLQTNKVMISPPSHILTRPRFHNPSSVTVSPALNVLGDQEIGFEITAMLKYKREDQEYTCNGMHRFTHQVKPITRNNRPLSASLTGLVNGAGKDFIADTSLENTSCDTDGSGYDDMTLTVDFSSMGEGQQAGTVILCRMNSYCVSYGSGSYGSCSPEKGRWQRCHNIQPNPSPTDQSWTYKAKLKAAQEISMTFEDMKPNRRYELNVGEFSMAAYNLRLKTAARFYIDATRPSMGSVYITNDAVGSPTDKREDRNYDDPYTNWIRPPSSTGNWIQCNTNTVEFAGDIVDQFIHNLETCVLTGSRRDGNGTSATSPTSTSDCGGELSSVAHGRQTITFTPSDSCSHRVTPPVLGTPKDLVWDTDLPSTFQTQNFSSNPFWLRSVNKDAYSIQTVVPGTGIGRFPKHYSVDCDDNFLNTTSRGDGNSGTLSCELGSSNSDHDDGCNPIEVSVKYYHVCGGNGDCEDSRWAVYAPHTESCLNVRCEPGLICCDGFRNECGTVSTRECETDSYAHSCSNPKGGGRSQQDAASGCPPLGLYDCSYTLPCEATSPCSETGPTSVCHGKRQGNSCSYSRAKTCVPNSSICNIGTSCSGSLDGTYKAGCDEGTCTARCATSCITPCSHDTTCTRCTAWSDTDNDGDLDCTATEDYTCKEHSCDSYRSCIVSMSMSPTNFSGSCGLPSGGCPKLGVGGGNLSSEQCSRRPATCNLCDPTTTCCTGHSYPTNTNCPCNSATHCCSGDTYPSNQNCTCNSATACCPGDAFPANPNCDPNNNCNDATTCCTGHSYPSNANCLCDSNTDCCQGDSHPSNQNCEPGCDNTTDCCQGDSYPSNQNCKVDGACSPDGCSQGDPEFNSNGRLWRCEGANGGTNDPPTGFCPVDGECGPPGKCKKGKPETQGAQWKCLGLGNPKGSDTDFCTTESECGSSICTDTQLCRNDICEEFGACGKGCTGPLCAIIDCETPTTCHVQDVGDGVCRPSCGHLANQQGYGGYGPDGIMTTADDRHIFSFHKWGKTSCAELNAVSLWGFNNWFKIPLINGIEPYDGIKIGRGGECCGRP